MENDYNSLLSEITLAINNNDLKTANEKMLIFIELYRHDFKALMHAILMPENSPSVKMPGDGLTKTFSFIQREIINIEPNSMGDFILFYFPNYVSETEACLYLVNSVDINNKSFYNSLLYSNDGKLKINKLDQIKGLISIPKLNVQAETTKEFRVCASAISARDLGATAETMGRFYSANDQIKALNKEITFAGGYGMGTITANGYITDAVINAIIDFSENFDSINKGSFNKQLNDKDGARVIYLPRDNADYDFKLINYCVNNLQCLIIAGENLTRNKGKTIEIEVVRHLEITVKDKFKDMLNPQKIRTSHNTQKTKEEVSKLPYKMDENALVLNTKRDVDEIKQVLAIGPFDSFHNAINSKMLQLDNK